MGPGTESIPAAASSDLTAIPAPDNIPAAMLELGRIFGEQDKCNWTPMELVQIIGKLPGVVGTIIAMQDGFLVASQLPPEMDGNKMAAFLPPIIARLEQYTAELNWGNPQAMFIVVDKMCVHVFNSRSVFFTVLGLPGKELPMTHIRAVAAYLDQLYKNL